MTFGLETTKFETSVVRVRGVQNIKPFFDAFKAHGHEEVDTARLYGNGDTELALGQLPMESFKIATKVWPTAHKAFGSDNLKRTFKESLTALNATKVDIFYLHAVDDTTPFEETVKAVDELYREGLFDRFGLSNFAAWQVALIYQLCKQHGYVVPTVYQGLYNAFSRNVQNELLPCLKALNIAFYAYSPIAGGLLSGKHKFEGVGSDGGRFDLKSHFGKVFRDLFWNTLYFEAVSNVEKVAKEHGLTLIETALRWLQYHSGLGPNDGIILGVSSVKNLEDNLKDLEKGPLPKQVVDAYDEAWEHVKVACPPYHWSSGSATDITDATEQ
ncbi:Aflatoxin B1 aldehyde reductase member 2 [Mortierella claussenii]|nr:Aflatoxin B1 aldehyde reductase member 2 [Mortierella claussenii]